METIEQWVTLAMNHGMSLLITCYFLYRDWKYQGALQSLLGTLSAAVERFNSLVDTQSKEE